ncbi:MAG TPA: Xaa-Pro peptidase family protein [Solirubrobacteraceae bacterium]|jgi:Xaa-Pro aminopeptidase|nr:Xaa-Pro peptidase family protein [Solirubrobacteraceae bacterium]
MSGADGSATVGSGTRTERLAAALREREVDVLLVASPTNLRYLTGFTGSNGLALVAADSGGEAEGSHRFFTDFRYTTQSAAEVEPQFERKIVTGSLIEAAVRALDGAAGKLGFDEASVTVAEHASLAQALPEGWELVGCAGAVERLRAVKDEREIERMRAAAQLADEALRSVLEDGLVGRSERDVAIELELRMRRLGAEAPSFSSIVASGAHGALPHAHPRAEPIPRDVLVTIDWGALHEGYCSDCTRTYATGEGISAQAREVYELVLTAQQAGVEAVKAGPTGREVDAVARAVIEQAGHGEHFGHGLGHGVGMEVHEAPRLSRVESERALCAGNVVTVEPGVYLPGELGVRIEDLLVVREGGQEALNGLEKTLSVIS